MGVIAAFTVVGGVALLFTVLPKSTLIDESYEYNLGDIPDDSIELDVDWSSARVVGDIEGTTGASGTARYFDGFFDFKGVYDGENTSDIKGTLLYSKEARAVYFFEPIRRSELANVTPCWIRVPIGQGFPSKPESNDISSSIEIVVIEAPGYLESGFK